MQFTSVLLKSTLMGLIVSETKTPKVKQRRGKDEGEGGDRHDGGGKGEDGSGSAKGGTTAGLTEPLLSANSTANQTVQ
jgi:hypothetical protein